MADWLGEFEQNGFFGRFVLSNATLQSMNTA